MSSELKRICPWCQTEIVWDPEIGPEDECPHCFNDLRDYRSVTFGVDDAAETDDGSGSRSGNGFAAGERDERSDMELDDDELGEEYRDLYGERVEQCVDSQEVAPECANCREFMLLAGTQVIAGETFSPTVPAVLGKPLLQPPLTINVYVCPSCYKTETYLSEQARLAMTRILKEPD